MTGSGDLTGAAAALAILPAVAYLRAARCPRSRAWPRVRTLSWLAGLLVVVGSAHLMGAHDPRRHTVGHLGLGLVAPLLLVLASPVRCALRALPVAPARRLVRALRSPVVRWTTKPVVAAVLDLGGLWLIFTTPVLGWSHTRPILAAVIMVHFLVGGSLLTAALVSPDPMPHRRSLRHRAVVLVMVGAGHGMLAKALWVHPSPGVVPGPAAEQAAMIMFYGGDAVEIILLVLLGMRWYALAGRRPARPAHPPADGARGRHTPVWG